MARSTVPTSAPSRIRWMMRSGSIVNVTTGVPLDHACANVFGKPSTSDVDRRSAESAITSAAFAGETCPRYSTFRRARKRSAARNPDSGEGVNGVTPPQTTNRTDGALRAISTSRSGRLVNERAYPRDIWPSLAMRLRRFSRRRSRAPLATRTFWTASSERALQVVQNAGRKSGRSATSPRSKGHQRGRESGA